MVTGLQQNQIRIMFFYLLYRYRYSIIFVSMDEEPDNTIGKKADLSGQNSGEPLRGRHLTLSISPNSEGGVRESCQYLQTNIFALPSSFKQ